MASCSGGRAARSSLRSPSSASGALSPMVSRPRSCKFGSPSRNRIRSMRRSACFISSIDSFFSYSSSFLRPQLPNILACRKYWLIAVSSLKSTLLRCWMTLASPFIAVLRELAMPSLARSLGRACEDLAAQARARLLEQIAGAFPAAAAAGTQAELRGQIVDRLGALPRALLHGLVGDGVTDAAIHVG